MDRPVYHYYNAKYSETGLISDCLEKVFRIMAKDFADGSSMKKTVKKALEETGYFDCFHAKICKTTIKGNFRGLQRLPLCFALSVWYLYSRREGTLRGVEMDKRFNQDV